jgi:DNA-directed RNA polymerase subunit RPC12/RpoP
MTSKDVSFLTYFKNKEERTEMIAAIKKHMNVREKECSKCGKTMRATNLPYTHYYKVGDKERKLTINNAPHYECECGHRIINLILYAEVEEAVENEIFYRLNKRKDIPNEVEFNSLIIG